MERDWETALSKFIKSWKSHKEVVGAVACGSYVTGNPSRHSDIDVQILLDKNVKWRERGNEIIDGILIEYFANPLPQNLKYYEKDYKDRDMTNVHMFLTGRVLFDKNGDVRKLVRKAAEYEKRPFKKLDKGGIEISKYSVWDMNDNLEEVFEKHQGDFAFVYFNYLNELLTKYASFLRYQNLRVNKVRRFLTSKKDQTKYRVRSFPDKRFKELYLKAISYNSNKTEMLRQYKNLTAYVLGRMGGFKVNGWKIRTKVES